MDKSLKTYLVFWHNGVEVNKPKTLWSIILTKNYKFKRIYTIFIIFNSTASQRRQENHFACWNRDSRLSRWASQHMQFYATCILMYGISESDLRM